jgi:hypothetical protein
VKFSQLGTSLEIFFEIYGSDYENFGLQIDYQKV